MGQRIVTLPTSNLPDGITTIDVGYIRPGLACSHMLIENGHAVFIDTGTTHSIHLLINELHKKGLSTENVSYVIPTHVHLDHAGGAGALMKIFPNAKLIIHPRGEKHMIDPKKLIAGTLAVYGMEMTRKLYGEIIPVNKERILVAEDKTRIDFHGRSLLFLDTPGHANHHFSIIDESSNCIFSGDNFGISYREFDNHKGPFIFPSTTPVQFEPFKMKETIVKLMSYKPQCIYLTHFGRITEVEKLGLELIECLDQLVEMALKLKIKGDTQQKHLYKGVNKIIKDRLKSHECHLSEKIQDELLANDFQLNAQGIGIWLSSLKE